MTTTVAARSYLFGVVPAGTRLPDIEESGPARRLRLVEDSGLAGVVGSPPPDRSLGRAADLLAHDTVLAALVDAGTSVLPMRFGALLRDDSAVVDDVLAARRDSLRAALDRVAGRVQFTLRVRYDQDVVLREVLGARPDIARLRGPATGDSLEGRMRLGELVVRALDELRDADSQAVLDGLRDVVDVRVNKTASPEDVLNAALLVEHARRAKFERGVERLARHHHPRLRMRLVGPSAAYDFVGAG